MNQLTAKRPPSKDQRGAFGILPVAPFYIDRTGDRASIIFSKSLGRENANKPNPVPPAQLVYLPRMRFACFLLLTLLFGLPPFSQPTATAQILNPPAWHDGTDEAGLAGLRHTRQERYARAIDRMAGGVAVADIDLDGDPDIIYITGGQTGAELRLNDGAGHFTAAPVDDGITADSNATSPLFFYFDGDAYPDLLIGSSGETPPRLFRNLGNRRFEEITDLPWASLTGLSTSGATAVDLDRDGDQDLFFCHWGQPFTPFHFYLNQGDGTFVAADEQLGFANLFPPLPDYGFTANFRDLDNNGYPDLLLTGDFGTTQLWYNDGRRLSPADHTPFTDENGMGAAVADFDNDGDEDWYVTSIHDGDGVTEGHWGTTGNRLYENLGEGNFQAGAPGRAATETGWGWAATAADLDHDGWLDLVVTNGWPRGDDDFKNDSTVVLAGDGSGTFSPAPGFPPDTAQGRGLSLLDVEGDGDLDVLVANYNGPARLFINNVNDNNWVGIVRTDDDGRVALGTSVTLFTTVGRYSRTVGESSNYASQNEAVAHFGLPGGARVDSVRIEPPTGLPEVYYNLQAGRYYRLPGPVSAVGGAALATPAVSLYPNPAHWGDRLVVDHGGGRCSGATLTDLAGRRTNTLSVSETQWGQTSIHLPDAAFAPGSVYLLNLKLFSGRWLPPVKIYIH